MMIMKKSVYFWMSMLLTLGLFSACNSDDETVKSEGGSAQDELLIYEKDWTGVEYSEGNYFAEDPDWSYYRATDEGLAITNPSLNHNVWQVRVINIPIDGSNIPLKEGHEYFVRLTIKIPSDGSLFMQLGYLTTSWYDFALVTASDSWQVIDIDSPHYYPDLSSEGQVAHVLLGLGEMIGTTVLKKVQVYERVK